MSTKDFWDDMGGAFANQGAGFDAAIQGKELNGPAFTTVRDTIEKTGSLELPVVAGTRVHFRTTLDSVLTYPNVPGPKVAGTVVTVRTGSGDTTFSDGRVFVAWDDGMFRPVAPEHLRLAGSRQAKSVRIVVSDLGDLTAFMEATGSSRSDELIHKATKDLWAVRKQGDNYAIERLFSTDGEPLKGV
jgi:hypothetical protein